MSNRFLVPFTIVGLSAILLLTVIGLASRSDVVNAAPNAQAASTTQTLTVSGTGTVTTQPDQASFTIGVQMTAPTLAAATQQASDALTKVLAAIKSQGVDDKDIQTSEYTINPITNSPDGQSSQVTGYQVSHMYTVKVRTISDVGKVLDAGVSAGANFVGNISFDVADPTTIQNQARTLAVHDATKTAQTLAQAAGVKVGQVISITDITTSVPPPRPFAANAVDSAGIGPVETGSLDLTVNVQVQYAISQ
jgi:uncharacterized protein YggE